MGACHKAPVRTVTGPPPTPPPMPVSPPPPVPLPSTWPELPLPPSVLSAPPEPLLPKNYRDGETSFQTGKYADAIRSYEKYLLEDPVTQYRDVAMFKLGLANTLACASAECRARSLEKSQEQFKRLVSLFPKSPYSTEARFILSLQNDIEKMKTDAKSREEKIKKLTDELERLKKIDLERQTSRTKK
jgi:tetratricopeptide (TPR) repeat protein